MNGPIRQPCDEGWLRSASAVAECGRRAEPWVLAATILASSMAFIDGTVVNVALPVLQEAFGTTVAWTQWVVESYALFLAALLLPGGALGDRYGHRRVLAGGVVLFAAASGWCGLAPSVGQLVLARATQGIGAAVLIPTSLALLGTSFPPERRGRAIGTWSAFSALTMAIGPVFGGWLVESVSWRAVFYINLPLALFVLWILLRRVPAVLPQTHLARLDWPGICLVATGLGGVTYGLIESPNSGSGNAAVITSLGVGGIALALFLLVESRSPYPMLPLSLFRSRQFSGANALTLMLYGALAAVLFLLPFNLQQVQGYSPAAAGAALLPFSVILFLFSRWSGGIADRVGVRVPLVLGPLIAAVGIALFALPGGEGSYWTTFFPAVSVLGLGMAVTVAPLTTSVLEAVGDKDTGIASGVNNAVSRVAGLLTVALVGLIMLGVFAAGLERRLQQEGTPPGVMAELLGQRSKLAAIKIPDHLDPATRAGIHQAIAGSFVAAFRRVMWICSAMALAGAAAIWVLLPPRGRSIAPQVRRPRCPGLRGVNDGTMIAVKDHAHRGRLAVSFAGTFDSEGDSMFDRSSFVRAVVISVFCLLSGVLRAGASYHEIKRIVLGGEGGWDLLAVDAQARRLYITRSNRVLVVDTDDYRIAGEIPNTPGVHGVAVAPDLGRGFTTNGADSSVMVFDLHTLAPLGRVDAGVRPDAIVYDPAARRVFVMNAGSGNATVIDAARGEAIGTVTLGGRPELAAADGAGRLFVNLEDSSAVVAIDTKNLEVLSRWPLAPGEHPTGLAVDPRSGLLFSACANQMMVVMSTKDGRIVTTLPIGKGVDGAAFDIGKGLAFTSNGEGTLTVVREQGPDSIGVVETVPTQAGARTLALDEKTHRVFLVSADFGPAPEPTPERPHPRRPVLPGTFVLLVYGE